MQGNRWYMRDNGRHAVSQPDITQVKAYSTDDSARKWHDLPSPSILFQGFFERAQAASAAFFMSGE